MRFSNASWSLLFGALLSLTSFTSAARLLQTSSLTLCQDNSKLSATKFDVVFTPDNGILSFDILGTTTVTGNVTFDIRANAYGLSVYKGTLNPCDAGLPGMCPMNSGPLNINSSVPLPANAVSQVPGIAYTVPDLDASVQIFFNRTNTGESLACIQAQLSNGKTVYLPAVCWVIAVITGLGLIASAVASGLGHSNTAAHVAANTISLFSYFQGQAFIGMTAVRLPPIVAAWTQDFQWSMGIIRVGFIQDIATWYQRATGGTPSTVLSDLNTESVEVQKRSVEVVYKLIKRSVDVLHRQLLPRAGSTENSTGNGGAVEIVRGINRVGFRADVEETNVFMTGYIFLVIFVLFVVLFVVLFKLVCEGLVKAGRMRGDRFSDFRNGWTTVLKGILFRVALIGFPQMVVLCFWELTVRDSAAIVVLAIFTIFTLLAVLVWAASKVIRLARRSINMHKNPAYILYSDPITLNKWGFLYVSYKATAYYWVVVALIYILIKGLFVGLGQGNSTVQAIGLLIIDAAYFIALCVLTPFMDKKTNAFNIAIQVVLFLNAIFLLFFTGIFGQPGIVTGAMGIIFFFINAVFSLILLVLLMVASGFALFSKNPDVRYAPMRDDRGSFIKSQSHLPNELDALGATARGEGRNGQKPARIEDDEDGYSSSDISRVGGNSSSMAGRYNEQNIPGSPHTGYNSGMYHNEKPSYYQGSTPRSGANSPAPGPRPNTGSGQNRASPWQRGAGYD